MMLTHSYMDRHKLQKAAADSDQAEFKALIHGSAVIDSGLYDERTAGIFTDFALDALTQDIPDDWHAKDLACDDSVGDIIQQLQERQKLISFAYPFNVDAGNISHDPKNTNLVYEFCLALCNAPSLTKGVFRKLPRLFELVSTDLIRFYMGVNSCSFHSGWPRSDNQPSRFRDLMQELHKLTEEWIWKPEDFLPPDPDPATAKDEGIDFVIWKTSPDARKIGQLFIIGQCACGNNWPDKFNDIDVQKLKRWFKPMTLVPPVKAFATPFHITTPLLTEASRQAGLVFDRLRLAAIATKENAIHIENNYGEEMKELIEAIKNSA